MPKEKSAGGAYYAVARGRSPGVYTTWDECLKQTSGFPGSKYKKFYTLGEAKEWVKRPDAATTSTPKEVTKMIRSTVDESGWQVVYSDGACKGNGAPGSVAGIGVWWGSDDPRNIAERCPGSQTNNRAELIALIRALEATKGIKSLKIKSDSKYSINCVTKWLPIWRKCNFISSKGEPVKNQSLIKYLDALLEWHKASGDQVRLEYVKGHAGIEGNEGADQLANKGCTFPEVSKEPDWTNLEAKVRKVTALTESKAKQTVAHVAGPSREPDKVPLPISTSEISRASFSTQMLKSDPYSPGSSSFEPLSSPGRASRGFKPTTAVAYVPNATPSVATPSRPAYMPTRTMNLPSYESGPTVPEVTRPTFTPTRVMRSPMIMPEVECSIPYRRARKGVDPNTTYRDVGVVTIAIPDDAPPVISAPKPVATQSVELTLEDLDMYASCVVDIEQLQREVDEA